MLDTCVINRILDGQVDNSWPLRGRSFVTDIQLQEILDTPNEARRTPHVSVPWAAGLAAQRDSTDRDAAVTRLRPQF
jgi:hypothetical protein